MTAVPVPSTPPQGPLPGELREGYLRWLASRPLAAKTRRTYAERALRLGCPAMPLHAACVKRAPLLGNDKAHQARRSPRSIVGPLPR